MRRSALAAGLIAMAWTLSACGSAATPSSNVTTTQVPSASAEAAASIGASAPASASTSAAPSVAPSPTPTATAAPTPTPSPTPKPTPVPLPACGPAMLTAKVTQWEGAMGSQIATVLLTNSSASTCIVRGTPRLQLLDKAGHVLIDSKTAGASGLPHVSPGDPTFKLAPSGSVMTMVQVANYCGATNPVLPTTIAFYLPNTTGRLVAKADPNGPAPSCFGNPGSDGEIQMNGWAKP